MLILKSPTIFKVVYLTFFYWGASRIVSDIVLFENVHVLYIYIFLFFNIIKIKEAVCF